MAPLNAIVLRRRAIRELVLRMVYNTHMSAPGIAVLAAHIYDAFGDGVTQYDKPEIDAELIDLADDGLIDVKDVPQIGAPNRKGYTITGRGRDFHDAGCPWNRVDEYTGDQTAG